MIISSTAKSLSNTKESRVVVKIFLTDSNLSRDKLTLYSLSALSISRSLLRKSSTLFAKILLVLARLVKSPAVTFKSVTCSKTSLPGVFIAGFAPILGNNLTYKSANAIVALEVSFADQPLKLCCFPETAWYIAFSSALNFTGASPRFSSAIFCNNSKGLMKPCFLKFFLIVSSFSCSEPDILSSR